MKVRKRPPYRPFNRGAPFTTFFVSFRPGVVMDRIGPGEMHGTRNVKDELFFRVKYLSLSNAFKSKLVPSHIPVATR